jgi:2-desacetyl-2-hydroxyethyl bacteriochlorophyllide A dehydrogenase
MQALHYLGPEQLVNVELPKPTIADDEVLLKIKSVGICGTDLHIFHGGMNVPTPLVMGHEFVGEVVEVGKDVSNTKVGDRAVAEHVVGCGKCAYCLGGQKNLCIKPTVIGLHRQGALAEYMAIPANLVYPMPSEMTYDQGVLIEPLSIAVYAIRKAAVTVGQSVAVVGQGPIGLFVDQVARAAGATVYGLDVQQPRLDFAQKQSYIEAGFNSKEPEVSNTFRQQTSLDGADVVFECVGREETMEVAFELARPGGAVIVLGVFEHNVSLNMMQVVKKELEVQGSWTCLNAFPPTIELLRSGKISTDGLITHRYPFSDAAKAFTDASSYSENRIKSVIEFP